MAEEEKPPREGDSASLQRYLLSFDWAGRQAAVEEMIVAGGLPLWEEILRLVPVSGDGGRLLELGSPPFHTTLLVQKFRPYRIAPTAGLLDARSRFAQRVESRRFDEAYEFDCRCLDLERETFPFPEASFDVVLFCEVIEHLTENPVATLSEIHRVLKPGGSLVISTPNAASSGHVMRLWLGVNVFDQYHLGSPLRGTRHSHEYTLKELGDLVGGCGFDIEKAYGKNLGQIQYSRRTRPLEPFFRLLTALAPGVHADHLFLRAQKAGAFRWRYPRELFEEGHLTNYLDVRADDVVMGVNDVPHTTGSWGPLVERDGSAARGIGAAVASVHMLVGPSEGQNVFVDIAATAAPTRVTAAIYLDSNPSTALATASMDLKAGAATCLEVRLPHPSRAGERVRVDLTSTADARVTRVRLAP